MTEETPVYEIIPERPAWDTDQLPALRELVRQRAKHDPVDLANGLDWLAYAILRQQDTIPLLDQPPARHDWMRPVVMEVQAMAQGGHAATVHRALVQAVDLLDAELAAETDRIIAQERPE